MNKIAHISFSDTFASGECICYGSISTNAVGIGGVVAYEILAVGSCGATEEENLELENKMVGNFWFPNNECGCTEPCGCNGFMLEPMPKKLKGTVFDPSCPQPQFAHLIVN